MREENESEQVAQIFTNLGAEKKELWQDYCNQVKENNNNNNNYHEVSI